MVDLSRLSANWLRWAPGMGGGNVSVSTDCADCVALFSTDDYSVHLRNEQDRWIVDTVNNRGRRRNGAAKLSNFALTEKYLIWDWATTARSSLASGALGADLARRGCAPGVNFSKVEGGSEICRTTIAPYYQSLTLQFLATSCPSPWMRLRGSLGRESD